MEKTDRLQLPLIAPGQAQKELFHNEALQALDTLVGGAVEGPPSDTPPAAPAAGQSYLVGDSPTGEWAQYPEHVAAFTSGGWRFIAPRIGLSLVDQVSGSIALYGAGGWEIGVVRGSKVVVDGNPVVGAQAGAIAGPSGGAFVDSESRAAVSAILAAMRQHGLISS